MSRDQLSIDFEPGLLEQFPEFMDCVRAAVYSCGKPLKIVAADCDMSESMLSRRLANNPDDHALFPLRALPALVRATGDRRPVEWLALTFFRDEEQTKQHAMQRLVELAPVLANLIAQAGLHPPVAKGRR